MKKALVILIVLGLLLINVVSVSAKDSGTPIKNQGIDYTWIEEIDIDTRHIIICYYVVMYTFCYAPLYVPQDAILTFHGPVELEELPTEGPPYYVKFVAKDDAIVQLTVIDLTNYYIHP